MFFYYMAYRSMMEMEHSDWFLSRSIFSSPDRQMDRSDGPLTSRFVLLWTINLFQRLCCIVQNGFSFENVEWKKSSTRGNRDFKICAGSAKEISEQ